MPLRTSWNWLGDEHDNAKRIFFILFPIMCCVFVFVLIHYYQGRTDRQIVHTQLVACRRGHDLRDAVNEAHLAIYQFMTAAMNSVGRRAALEHGAKRRSDLLALKQYTYFRSRFHLVPQVDCEVAVLHKKPKHQEANHT